MLCSIKQIKCQKCFHEQIIKAVCKLKHPTGGGSVGSGGSGGSGGTSDSGLDSAKPLDGHSVIGGSISNNQLKTLQGELSEVILTFSSINDTLKGLEHTMQKHGSVITDLGERNSPTFVDKPFTSYSLINPLTPTRKYEGQNHLGAGQNPAGGDGAHRGEPRPSGRGGPRRPAVREHAAGGDGRLQAVRRRAGEEAVEARRRLRAAGRGLRLHPQDQGRYSSSSRSF